MSSSRTDPSVPRSTKVFKLKMSAAVAAYTKGKPTVGLKLPLIYAPGDRLWMVEWAGAPTGRADLCTVLGEREGLLYIDRRMCWQQQKFDDDLSCVSLTIQPDSDRVKMLDRSVIPDQGVAA